MAFKEFEICIKPELNLTVWRYMDLDKFESLLKNNALFFCRPDRFPDPYEGSIPRKEADARFNIEKNITESYGYEFDPIKAQNNIEQTSKNHRQFKKQHIINCWHINNSENDSMWRLYLTSNDGIAIKTTVDKLLDSFSNSKEKIYCSKVRYLDYENDVWYDEIDYPIGSYNMFIPLIHKRLEFKQEEEIRLIYKIEDVDDFDKFWKQQPNQNGKNIKVEIENLIDKVYTAPTSDDYQIDKIKQIISKYNFDFEVQKSNLSKEPYY